MGINKYQPLITIGKMKRNMRKNNFDVLDWMALHQPELHLIDFETVNNDGDADTFITSISVAEEK